MGKNPRRGRFGFWILQAAAMLAGLGLLAGWPASAEAAATQSSGGSEASGSLTAFRSDGDLRRYLRRLGDAQRRRAAANAADSGEEVVVTGSALPSITNNQEAGVEEGGIVKLSGDILVVLRRGRLFTVSLAGGGMRRVDMINAFPPGVDGQGDWYDEMLVSGDWVVVVGYSYARGGTEIDRFRMDRQGRLSFQDAYHLRSNDYYSTRNYASRLIGNRLVFYTPLYLEWGRDPLDALPGMRKWRSGEDRETPFRRIASAQDIYIAPNLRRNDGADVDTLHSVTTCDLSAPELDCAATGVFGPSSRTFYVARGAVYLWVTAWSDDEHTRDEPDAFVYRLPFGDEPPFAIGARGEPVDQFSFREDRDDDVLNVLLREEGGGDAMANPEFSGGRVSLLRVPIAAFGDGSRPAGRGFYRQLPGPNADSWEFRNRFVGDHVLYGTGSSGDGERSWVFAAPLRGGPVARLELTHTVDRIEILGRDAVVIGGAPDDSLRFTTVALSQPGAARLGDSFTLPASGEGESRSHAYFFRPTTPDGADGVLGLPVRREAEPAYDRLFGSAASMLFLRRDASRFASAGELSARMANVADDGCKASCTDWYGNARPIFIRDRVFALLGYELVEGRLDGGRIREIGRLSFAPPTAPSRGD